MSEDGILYYIGNEWEITPKGRKAYSGRRMGNLGKGGFGIPDLRIWLEDFINKPISGFEFLFIIGDLFNSSQGYWAARILRELDQEDWIRRVEE